MTDYVASTYGDEIADVYDVLFVDSQLVRLSEKGVQLFPIRIRYAWPAELDLMARVAGLRLRDRWSGWNRQPFSSASPAHVSVYERGD